MKNSCRNARVDRNAIFQGRVVVVAVVAAVLKVFQKTYAVKR